MPSQNDKKEPIDIAKESDTSFIGEPDDKRLVIQMHKPMWAELRRLAFDLDISMAELCRRGITLLLAQAKNHSQ